MTKPGNNNGTSNKQQQQTQRQAQLEVLRKQASTSAVTLSTKQATSALHETLTNMPNKAIAERLQTVLDNKIEQPPKILGISKLNNAIRMQFGTEDAANATRSAKLDWNTALGVKTGVSIHKPSYGVVVHQVSTSAVDPDAGPDAIEAIEKQNNIASGNITKLTNLQRKSKPSAGHRSIVLHFNNVIEANKCITNGVYIEYTRHITKRYCPQYQITQCFKCHQYGHQAVKCKSEAHCGKCGDEHTTQDCKVTNLHCLHCSRDHEAWHGECPIRIAEKKRMKELMNSSTRRLFEENTRS